MAGFIDQPSPCSGKIPFTMLWQSRKAAAAELKPMVNRLFIV
jgi:hypothetical protein